MSIGGRYVLDDQGNPKEEPDLMTWARWFEKADRHVAKDKIGDADISTVFISLDHNFESSGPPILWETMIFGGAHDGYQEQYSSLEDALVGHARAKALVIAGGPLVP